MCRVSLAVSGAEAENLILFKDVFVEEGLEGYVSSKIPDQTCFPLF